MACIAASRKAAESAPTINPRTFALSRNRTSALAGDIYIHLRAGQIDKSAATDGGRAAAYPDSLPEPPLKSGDRVLADYLQTGISDLLSDGSWWAALPDHADALPVLWHLSAQLLWQSLPISAARWACRPVSLSGCAARLSKFLPVSRR